MMTNIGKYINRVANVAPWMAGRLGYQIFCTPRRQPETPAQTAILNSAKTEILSVQGHKTSFYRWQGADPQAPTVLFLHGWDSSSARWRLFIEPMVEAGYTVWAFDAPGNGRSNGKTLNLLIYSKLLFGILQKTGVPYAMVGHSLGAGVIVMGMARFGIPKIPKAVLMGAFAESSRILADFGRLLGLNEKAMSAISKEIKRRGGLPIEAYSIRYCAEELEGVQALVIHDETDPVSPASDGRQIAEAWHAEYFETKGLGHSLQSLVVVNRVIEFLKR